MVHWHGIRAPLQGSRSPISLRTVSILYEYFRTSTTFKINLHYLPALCIYLIVYRLLPTYPPPNLFSLTPTLLKVSVLLLIMKLYALKAITTANVSQSQDPSPYPSFHSS